MKARVTEFIKSAAAELTVVNRHQRRKAATLIRLHIGADKSGSFWRNDPARMEAMAEFIRKASADPVLNAILYLAVTELSNTTRSSGYQRIATFKAVNLAPQGHSPYPAWLREIIAVDVAAEKKDGPADVVIHVLAGDWFSSFPAGSDEDQDIEGALAAYHSHCRNHAGGVHVFPVCIGSEINVALAARVSLQHKPYTDPCTAFDAIFANVLSMVGDVSQDLSALKGRESLDVKELQKRHEAYLDAQRGEDKKQNNDQQAGA